MNLWLITFNIDNTQFLVNADNMEDAISIAHKHNQMIVEIDDYDLNQDCTKDYTVEKVDFNLLSEIIKRNDIVFSTHAAIIFNG